MSLVISSNQSIVALVMIWTITIFFIFEARRNQKLHKIWGLNWMRSCERIKNKMNEGLSEQSYILRWCNSLVFYSIDRKKYIDQCWSQLIEKCNPMLEVLPQKGRDCLLAEKNSQTNLKTDKVDSSSLRSIIVLECRNKNCWHNKATHVFEYPGSNLRNTSCKLWSLIQRQGAKWKWSDDDWKVWYKTD
jgi:hypothetical protein